MCQGAFLLSEYSKTLFIAPYTARVPNFGERVQSLFHVFGGGLTWGAAVLTIVNR